MKRGFQGVHHLDLTETANLAVAAPFLAAVTGAGPIGAVRGVEVSRALTARLDAVGVEHVRTMAVEGGASELSASVQRGPGLGGSLSRVTVRQRILDAATRGLDGVWRRRADCLARA